MAPTCSQCGTTVPLPNDELSGLPQSQPVSVLCSSCSTSSSPIDPHQAHRPTRTFRVTLAIQEWEGPTTDHPQSEKKGLEPHSEQSGWVDVGRFTLRGANSSVAAFVDQQSTEFQQRMQMILDFADTEPPSPATTPSSPAPPAEPSSPGPEPPPPAEPSEE